MKTKGGSGIIDSYCVAKYGQKWVRMRTIIDRFDPSWNEKYTWEFYDPCIILTLGIFDNWYTYMNSDKKSLALKGVHIGKVDSHFNTGKQLSL